MLIYRCLFLIACLMLAVSARAQDTQPAPAIGDVVYKGIVGKALDAVPMDPEHRTALQRTNAVVSNTLTGRSLSVWAGLTNPVLLIAGVVWGIYSATNIKAVAAIADTIRVDHPVEPVDNAPAAQIVLLAGQPEEVDNYVIAVVAER